MNGALCSNAQGRWVSLWRPKVESSKPLLFPRHFPPFKLPEQQQKVLFLVLFHVVSLLFPLLHLSAKSKTLGISGLKGASRYLRDCFFTRQQSGRGHAFTAFLGSQELLNAALMNASHSLPSGHAHRYKHFFMKGLGDTYCINKSLEWQTQPSICWNSYIPLKLM